MRITLPFVGSSRTASGTYDAVFGYIFGYTSSDGTGLTKQYYAGFSSHYYYIPSSLRLVTITDATQIPYGAFYNCSMLTSVTIPDSVTRIGDEAFYGCSSLTSITIPDSVTSIGRQAFYDCTSLTSITIPDSVTSIGDEAFFNTAYYNNSSNWENRVLYIGKHLIVAKTSISGAYTIKPGILAISDWAFENCTLLTSITIPDSVTSIGDRAFYECSSLTSITIPDSVTSIGDYAFYECSSLTSITIPDSVTSIGDYAFFNTAYYNNSSNWENRVLYIGKHLIVAKTSISGAYTIKPGILAISDWAFYGCSSLTSITIPDSVTSIGNKAFYGCSSLTSITMSRDDEVYLKRSDLHSCRNVASRVADLSLSY